MVTCELDDNISGELLGWKLPAWQALLLHRVLPSSGGLVVYMTLMCYDLTLIYEHYRNGDKGIVTFSLILMTLPALLTFIFTMASAPAGLSTEADSMAVNIDKNTVRWILLQILNLLLFPLAAIGRYCHQIFWWIESVCAAYVEDDERTQEAIQTAREPSSMELYLFLQSFIHAAPHSILNILEMMAFADQPVFEKVSLQSISVVVSCLRMASTVTTYRRFEREKLCGRRYPWNANSQSLIENTTNKIIEDIYKDNVLKEETQLAIKQNEQESTGSGESEERMWMKYENLMEFSDSDSGCSIPRPRKRNVEKESVNSDDNYVRPISIIDKVAPRRSGQYIINGTDNLSPANDSDDEYIQPISFIDKGGHYRENTLNIETVDCPPPPEAHAPVPGRLSVWAEKLVDNAESIPLWLSAPQRKKYNDEVIQDEPDIPTRVPRSYMRGLEPQDASAALVHYLGWYMFFIGRLLSLAAFINLYPIISTIILMSQYQIMLLLLIVPQASTVRRGFYMFLAFIYLFCLMEFKVRFRHVRVWHVFWVLVCTLETVIFTTMWATIDNVLSSWWRQYVILVIFGSTLLSYMCLLVYFLILKPRETIVYVGAARASRKL